MWWMLLAWADKPEGALPVFEDAAPRITCCPSTAGIRDAVKAKRSDLAACGTVPGEPSSSARRLRWTIQPDGRITDVDVALGRGDALDTCVRDIVSTLDVPAYGCTVVVSYPMPFADPAEALQVRPPAPP